MPPEKAESSALVRQMGPAGPVGGMTGRVAVGSVGGGEREAREAREVVRSSPDRIRTGVTALRGRRPRPLDDGAEHAPAGILPGPRSGITGSAQTTASTAVRPTGCWRLRSFPRRSFSETIAFRDEQARTSGDIRAVG